MIRVGQFRRWGLGSSSRVSGLSRLRVRVQGLGFRVRVKFVILIIKHRGIIAPKYPTQLVLHQRSYVRFSGLQAHLSLRGAAIVSTVFVGLKDYMEISVGELAFGASRCRESSGVAFNFLNT